MTMNRFLTVCGSKTGFVFSRFIAAEFKLNWGRRSFGMRLNKFACLQSSKRLMAKMRVYYF
jgi:hypothetical protein